MITRPDPPETYWLWQIVATAIILVALYVAVLIVWP